MGLLSRLFRRRRPATFSYWDGARRRQIDPLAAWRALDQHPTFDLASHPKQILDGDSEAIGVALPAIREVFGIQPWSETQKGLTESETLVVLLAFMDYADALKKKPSRSPISPSPTAPPASGPLTPKPGLDSGSISSEPSAAPPPEFSSAPATPPSAS